MSDAYQKTIQFLQVYRDIPRAQNLLAKATNKLLEEEEEFRNLAEIGIITLNINFLQFMLPRDLFSMMDVLSKKSA